MARRTAWHEGDNEEVRLRLILTEMAGDRDRDRKMKAEIDAGMGLRPPPVRGPWGQSSPLSRNCKHAPKTRDGAGDRGNNGSEDTYRI